MAPLKFVSAGVNCTTSSPISPENLSDPQQSSLPIYHNKWHNCERYLAGNPFCHLKRSRKKTFTQVSTSFAKETCKEVSISFICKRIKRRGKCSLICKRPIRRGKYPLLSTKEPKEEVSISFIGNISHKLSSIWPSPKGNGLEEDRNYTLL